MQFMPLKRPLMPRGLSLKFNYDIFDLQYISLVPSFATYDSFITYGNIASLGFLCEGITLMPYAINRKVKEVS